MTSIKNGTIRRSCKIDFTGDLFNRSHKTDPGHYVMFGIWKGPFQTEQEARDAYREWSWEAQYS